MHADVRDVRRHEAERALASDAEHLLIARRVELKDRCSVLEPLRPLGPSAGGVLPLNGEHGGAVGILPAFLEVGDLWGGGLEDFVGSGLQRGRGEFGVDLDHVEKGVRLKAVGLLGEGKRSGLSCVFCVRSWIF
jgi:hypothetical protein